MMRFDDGDDDCQAAQLELRWIEWIDRMDRLQKPRKRSGFREGETERVSGQWKEPSGTQEANRRWARATPQQSSPIQSRPAVGLSWACRQEGI